MRRGKITSYDHDTVGAKIVKDFLHFYSEDEEFVQKVSALVKYHMHMLYILKGLPFGNIENMVNEVDTDEIGLLCRCDRLGRAGVDRGSVEIEYQEFRERLKTSIISMVMDYGVYF